MRLKYAIVLATCACFGGCQAEPAKLAIPQTTFCIPQSRWPALLSALKDYGTIHQLKFIGGVETIGEKNAPLLNVALAQGYSYYFGDDMDLWLVSRPFESDPELVDFAAVVKKPATAEQRALALELMKKIQAIGPIAKQSGGRPVC